MVVTQQSWSSSWAIPRVFIHFSSQHELQNKLSRTMLISLPQRLAALCLELVLEAVQNGRHGATFINDYFELFILLLADDVVLLSETVIGLKTQLNSLQRASSSLQLKVNMSKRRSMHCEVIGHPPAPLHEGQWPK